MSSNVQHRATEATEVSNQDTNAYLEARCPTLARFVFSMMWSIYGIAWAIVCMIPIVVAIYLVIEFSQNLHDLGGITDVLESLWRPTLWYAQLIILHMLSGQVFKKSKNLFVCIGAKVFEIGVQLFYIGAFYQVWLNIYASLKRFVFSII